MPGKVIRLIKADIGRPLAHIATNVDCPDLKNDIELVLRQLISREMEVRTGNGEWYQMRIMPYRSAENVIDGAVLTFVSVRNSWTCWGKSGKTAGCLKISRQVTWC